ncbi:MAG: hypothetical protein Q7T86_09425 [Hyphomicrobiaceae bacterium]|nr:hypothetical protein [Hyphomicrobiaceae bacterium]
MRAVLLRGAVCFIGAAGLVAGPARAGPAVGQFEIKSLNAEPGEIEVQSQNAYSLGMPKRQTRSTADGLAGDDNSLPRQMHALEIEAGFSHHFKTRVGIEFEKERVDEFSSAGEAGHFDAIKLDEFEIEAILVVKRRLGDGFGFGLLAEYEHPFESSGQRTVTAGPIFEWGHGPWLASLNPRVTQFFGGAADDFGRRDNKLDFGYAAAVKYKASDRLDFALEAYGVLERVAGSGDPGLEAQLFGDFDQHRLGPVVYFTFPHGQPGSEAETKLGVGTLLGLNDDTPDATLKLSVEVVF